MRRRKTATALVVAVTLVGAGSAMAAHPRAGRIYAGATSAPAFNGFSPVASFTVSANGKKLLHFLYQSFGCFGSGGVGTPGVDYFLQPFNERKLGAIAVTSKGKFTLGSRRTSYSSHGFKTVTTSTVSGHFKSRDKAVGEIIYRQKEIGPNGSASACGPAKVTFTATLRRG